MDIKEIEDILKSNLGLDSKLLCACGCGGRIFLWKDDINRYKHQGIPKYLQGHYFKGKHLSEETKQKLREYYKNHPELIKRLNEINRGLNDEEKNFIKNNYLKYSNFKLSKISNRTVYIIRSYLHKNKLKRKRSIEQSWKNIALFKSKKHRLMLSLLRKGKPPSKETIAGVKKWRKTFVFPVKDTSIEIKIQNFLKELNIEFFTHQYMKIEHGYQCDILIPSLNLVVECDGNYWHKYPTRNDIDNIRTKEMIEKGFKVLRLWEVEIKELDINGFRELIYNIK